MLEGMSCGEETNTCELMTTEEVMRKLKVSKNTVSRWSLKGLLTQYKVGGYHIRYLSSEVNNLIKRRTH